MRNLRHILLSVGLVIGCADRSDSATFLVPSEYTTVQAAIDAATHGDEVVVATGTYYETIHFKGKDIRLRSTDPSDWAVVEATILTAVNGVQIPQSGPIVTFSGSETEQCSLSGFTLKGGESLAGAGIFGNGAFATVERNLISGNNGRNGTGGGVSGVNGAILSNRIENNHSREGGGLSHCDGLIADNRISGNTAHLGGGLSYCNGLIANNSIVGNTVNLTSCYRGCFSYAVGGGLYRCDGDIIENTIAENFCDGHGGGLADCGGLIQGNVIQSNQTALIIETEYGSLGLPGGPASGGGLFLCLGEISNNLITGNVSPYGGGLNRCDGVIRNNLIGLNVARGSCQYNCGKIFPCYFVVCTNPTGGGGLSLCNGTIQNNLIVGNKTEFAGGRGGGIRDCHGLIRNNTIFGNIGGRGGGISDCEGNLENCIVWANSATSEAQISGATPVYSNIQNWTQGGWGNISENPLFVDAENGDFNLKAISPCIDAGRNVLDLLTDYDGDERPLKGVDEHRGDGSGYDMGAEEFRPLVNPRIDIVTDYRIDLLDLFTMQRDWYRVTDVEATRKEIPLAIEPDTDIDLSGRTDMLDLFILLTDWGQVSG